MNTPTNQIICGDSIATLQQFQPESIDLVVTDPPYLVNYHDRHGRSLANDDNPSGVMPIYKELYRVLKNNRYCITFYGWNAIDQFSKAWTEAGFQSVGHIVWTKKYTSRAGHLQYKHESAYLLAKGRPQRPANPPEDIQPWHYSGNPSHPTQKDVRIIKPLIEAYSNIGDIILDPFLGSGTTAVAALQTKRQYIGIELEKNYCTIARNRLVAVERREQQLAAHAA